MICINPTTNSQILLNIYLIEFQFQTNEKYRENIFFVIIRFCKQIINFSFLQLYYLRQGNFPAGISPIAEF